MHDSRLEDQIRSVLSADGDGVPVTITTAELERRLTLRRRDRNGRRLALMAAAIAAIAVGSIVALGNGWVRMPAIGTDASPSPAPTASSAVATPAPSDAPSDLPSPSATTAPEASPTPAPTARVTPSLGGANDAVVVRHVGDPQIEVAVTTGQDQRHVVATLPVPQGQALVLSDARLGPTGCLAVPGDTTDEFDPAAGTPTVFVYDLATFDDEALPIEGGSGGMAWGPDGRLAILDALTITVVDPADGTVLSVTPVPAGINIASDLRRGAVWAADGSGLLASRVGVAATEVGIIGFDGTFTPVPAPSVFAPSGMQRVYDRDGRWLGVGCDSSAGAVSGCTVTAGEPGVDQVDFYSGNDIADQLWQADPVGIWLMTGSIEEGDTGIVGVHRATPSSMAPAIEVTLTRGVESRLAFDGATADDGRLAIGGVRYPNTEAPAVAVVDTADGSSYFAEGWFVGWADQSDAVYPAS